MDVTRFKDAGPAVSRICGHGSPIPIFAQVRGILAIWAHRCAAAIGSAHRRAPRRRQSVPSGPDRPHGGHSSLTARARCAQHGPTSASSPNPAAPQLSTYPATSWTSATPTDRACPPIPGPPPTRPGTFRAAGCMSFRAGAFDAVGDSNPVPERAGCPRLEESVPAHAECPPACQRALGDTAYVGRTQCRAPSAESVAPVPADGDRQHHHRRHHLRPRSLAHIVTIGDN